MVDLVSDWRVSVVAAAATVSMLWAVFVVPAGPPWTGFVWLCALAVLLLATPILLLGGASRAPTPSEVTTRGEPSTHIDPRRKTP